MGRPAKGPRVKRKRGWCYAHFTWEGHDWRIALFTKDERAAAKAAARAYAEVVSGQRQPPRRGVAGRSGDLADLLDMWIESKVPSLDPITVPTIEAYARRFVDTFETLENIGESTGAAYGMARLGQALRTTVNRELSYLREFLRWCRREGHLSALPEIPRLPPKAQGTRTGPQRAVSVHVSEEQASQILALLPEQSKKIGERKWPLRARFEFMWETALRPETLARLQVPDHWRPGSRILELTNEDDKARWGREVDLTDRAVELLEQVAPARGTIFGRHAFYKAIKRAAIAVLGPLKGKRFAPYDFRHGRAKHLLDAGGPIRGVSYQLGHLRVSTTDKYLAPERTAGRQALDAAGGFSVSAPVTEPTKRSPRDES